MNLNVELVENLLNNIYISNSELLVHDPTEDEEQHSLSVLTIVFNETDMCFVHKSGGVPISQNLLSKCVSKAKTHSEQVRKLILAAVATIKSNGTS